MSLRRRYHAPPSRRFFFHRVDLLVIAGLLFLSGTIWFFESVCTKTTHVQAEIYVDGSLIRTIDLSKAQNIRFSLPEAPSVYLEIRDKTIGFVSSSCPDHLCEAAGFLSRNGQTAVCLPKRVTVKLTADTQQQPLDIMVN